MAGFGRDFRGALRFLAARKGWTAAAVVSLALGIGANTVVFSIVESVVFRPFPYQNPDEIVLLWGSRSTEGGAGISVPDLEALRTGATTLDAIGWYQPSGSMSPGIEPEVPVGRVGVGVFDVLGVGPVLGRTFEESDRDTARIVLSYGFWQSRFGGDPGTIGQLMDVNSEPHEIIGVMPPGFFFPEPGVEFWLQLSISDRLRVERRFSSLRAVARLAAGTAIETARAELDLLSRQLDAEFPRERTFEVGIFPVHEVVLRNHELVLWMLLGAMSFVLLIGCLNVANLLLARAVARQKELALRATLGASRPVLIRQLLVESLLLASGAGILAVGLGFMGIRLILGLGLVDVPRIENAAMNWPVLSFALVVSLATGLISGFLPALRASRVDLTSSLRTGGQTSSQSGSNRLQDVLVVVELSVALVLLICAGLLVRSSTELGRIDWGFDPEGVAIVGARTTNVFFGDNDGILNRRIQFAESAIDRIAAIDGVSTVSVGVTAPLVQSGFALGERIVPEGGRVADAIMANRAFVTRGYFRAMGIPVEGREFDETDRAEARKTVVLSAGLARDLFGDADPLGKTIHFATPVPEEGESGQPRSIMISIGGGVGTLTINGGAARDYEVTGGTAHTVIGVADDVRMTDDLTSGTPAPTAYVDYRQAEELGLESDIILAGLVNPGTFVIRSEDLSQGLIDQVRGILVELNPDVNFVKAAPLEDLISEAIGGTGSNRLMLVLGVVFGGMSLLLAAAGVYGVMSHAVSQRTWEIGIRMALGAAPGRILSMILRRAGVLAMLGLTLGLVGAWAATRVLESMLFGIEPTDPYTFAVVTGVLLAIALISSLVPARRASRVDPLTATRLE